VGFAKTVFAVIIGVLVGLSIWTALFLYFVPLAFD
jgi:hypothetical protein